MTPLVLAIVALPCVYWTEGVESKARLEAAGGRLYLSGLSERTRADLARSDRLHLTGPVGLDQATPIIGESTRRAVADARAWLVQDGSQGSAGPR